MISQPGTNHSQYKLTRGARPICVWLKLSHLYLGLSAVNFQNRHQPTWWELEDAARLRRAPHQNDGSLVFAPSLELPCPRITSFTCNWCPISWCSLPRRDLFRRTLFCCVLVMTRGLIHWGAESYQPLELHLSITAVPLFTGRGLVFQV